jgi:signal transduction histidine kinase/CheY-like chemotaxis protein
MLQQKMQIAVSVANLGFWEYNYADKKITLSEEAAQITGINKSGELSIDELDEKILTTDKVDELKEKLRQFVKKEKDFEFIFTYTHPSDFKKLTLKLVAKKVLSNDKKNNKLLGIVQDISKQKISEEQLKKAKQEAEEANRLKSAFLANMSHEIRTPLNAILGFSRLLINEKISDIQKHEYSEYITNSANNLLNLIQDIIDVSKIEAGKINIERGVCYVNKILKELKTTFEKQKQNLNKNHIELILKTDNTDDNFTINTDAFRFNQIFTNLIGNALKFIESGYIEFGYIIHAEEYLQFYVKDTGIGIPPDKRDLVFSRFGQIINKKIKNPGGTGLGLSITQHLVEKLGGKIWYDSELDKGTSFLFTLPLDKNTSTPGKTTYQKHSKPIELKENINILAVEDDLLNMILLTDILSVYSDKIRIDKAENGRKALQMLKVNNYDLIIMDIRMPEMDGYETTKHIREKFTEPKSKIPILGLSAHAFKEEVEKGKSMGMDDFLSKPIEPKKLIEKIKDLTDTKAIRTKKTEDKPDINETRPDKLLLSLNFFSKLFKNDTEKIKKTITAYLNETPIQLKNLETNLKGENFEFLRLTAHSMKSTFRYIGRNDLSDIAKQIEMMSVDKKDEQFLKEKIDLLISAWTPIEVEIKKYLES